MSVNTVVVLCDNRLPSCQQWQNAIDAAGVDIKLDPTENLRLHSGYWPVRFNGGDTGFEWYYNSVTNAFRQKYGLADDFDIVVSLVTHNDVQGVISALFAASVLAKISDGLFLDETSGRFVSGDRAIEIVRNEEKAEKDRKRCLAEKDADITDRRCPQCGAPCPVYRRTCKACGFAIGRST